MFKRGIKLPFGADDGANTAADSEEPSGTGNKDETKPGKPKRKRKNALPDETNPEEPAAEGDANGKADPFKGNLDLEQLLADARTAVNKDAK